MILIKAEICAWTLEPMIIISMLQKKIYTFLDSGRNVGLFGVGKGYSAPSLNTSRTKKLVLLFLHSWTADHWSVISDQPSFAIGRDKCLSVLWNRTSCHCTHSPVFLDSGTAACHSFSKLKCTSKSFWTADSFIIHYSLFIIHQAEQKTKWRSQSIFFWTRNSWQAFCFSRPKHKLHEGASPPISGLWNSWRAFSCSRPEH